MTANEAEIPNLPIMAKMVVRILYTGLVPEKRKRKKSMPSGYVESFKYSSLINKSWNLC